MLNPIPVQKRISKREYPGTTQGILNDAHDKLISLRRNDLEYLDKYNP